MTWRRGGESFFPLIFEIFSLDCWLQPRLDLTRLCSIYFVFFTSFFTRLWFFFDFWFSYFYAYRGHEVYDERTERFFWFPFCWMIMFVCCFLTLFSYPFFLYETIWFLRNHEVWTLTFMPPSPLPTFFFIYASNDFIFLTELMQHSRTSPSSCLSPIYPIYLPIFYLLSFVCFDLIVWFGYVIFVPIPSPPPSPCLFFVFIDFWFLNFLIFEHIYNIYWYVFFLSVLSNYLLVQLYNMIYSYGYDDIHLRLVFVLGEVRWDELDWMNEMRVRVRWLV